LSATGSTTTTALPASAACHHGLSFFFCDEAILIGIQPFKEHSHLSADFVAGQFTIRVLVVFKHPINHLFRIESASPTFLCFGLGSRHDRNGCHH
jgi:hypothetical protein